MLRTHDLVMHSNNDNVAHMYIHCTWNGVLVVDILTDQAYTEKRTEMACMYQDHHEPNIQRLHLHLRCIIYAALSPKPGQHQQHVGRGAIAAPTPPPLPTTAPTGSLAAAKPGNSSSKRAAAETTAPELALELEPGDRMCDSWLWKPRLACKTAFAVKTIAAEVPVVTTQGCCQKSIARDCTA